MHSEFWNVPNVLSLSRIPLTALVCWAIAAGFWAIALVTFVLATLTDWLDGWWARRFHKLTTVGRALDPLTDKVMIASAFIFLIPVPDSGIDPWMVAVVVVREVLITGLRGMVEAAGKKFGADWFGKMKTVLQCAVLIGVLLMKTLAANEWLTAAWVPFGWVQLGLLWAMLAATVGSGVQYCVRAVRLFSPS
ncbi:MAG: CDP-alcohol phosphatidyltransferase family protein [Fimbriiglobus sp.]|jgi:CDP-diacylglycerol--glycerol-3-phosphate 3-phosphatidyltransferase|nr:CDP-alcohol phosphatidyltransferase family protein [Fimbriiglobus sp.]